MQRSVGLRFFAIALTLATSVFGFCAPALRAQADSIASGAVVAPGKPPLTESMVARLTNFQAWLLEIPFNQQQRERVRAVLRRDWTKPADIKTDVAWLSIAALYAKAPADEREFLRIDLQDRILKSARADKGNADSQWLVAAHDAAQTPIAAGSPPLTENMVSHYTNFVAWLLEIPITQAFKDSRRTMMLEDWKNSKDVDSDLRALKWQLDMAQYKYGQAERDSVRATVQPQLIARMRADTSNPDAQVLVAAFDAAHQPIAPGNPPLTRQAADAWTELSCFLYGKTGGQRVNPTQTVKDQEAQALAHDYPLLPVEKQALLSEMPQKWAAVRLIWLAGNEADRQKLLASWRPILYARGAADRQLAEAKNAQARVTAFMAKNPNTVTAHEMLRAAKDQDLVVAQYQRQGEQYKVAVASAQELDTTLHTGSKQAYLDMLASWKANGEKLAMARAYYASRDAMMRATSISNTYVYGDAAMANAITNINNSPYETIVVPVVPR